VEVLNQFIKSALLEGVLWFIFGMAVSAVSIKLRIGTLRSPGPGFVAFLSGAMLGLLGLVLMLSSFLKGLKNDKDEKAVEIFGKLNWRRIIMVVAVLWAYILLFQPLGFILSTFLFFFSMLYSFTKPQKWLMPLVISACTAILGYFLFSTCLGVQLPAGIFRF
jgi:putative tricarboxylic transport membrane protein